MAKKFKVMASNAKEPDGKCIPKSMRKSVESACGKKKAVEASDSECKYRIDIFKKDNPDALVKREFKMFKSEDEAKKYGESVANGNIVNVMKVNAGCTKKSVKSGKVLFPWAMVGRFADGYTCEVSGDSEADCIEKLGNMQDKHGELEYYSGVDDDDYDADGRRIYSSRTKRFGVKASKAAKKRVAAAKGYWADDINAENYRKILKALDDYLIANYDGKTIGDVEIGVSELRNIKDDKGSKIEVEFYSPDYEKDTKLEIISAPDLRSKFLCRVSVDPFKFDEELEIPQSGSKQIVVDKINEIANRLSGSAVESSCKTKKTVKASAAAKKRVANKKKIAASDYRDDDIVMYFNGDNVYTGSIYDLADAVENLCYDDEVNAKFQEWCNQFGDPFDFDGSPIDTARVFTDIIIHEADEAPETENGGSQFYEDGNGILDFEIFYANDGIYSAKSIKCTQGDFTDDFSEDEFPFRVTSYYDHSQRGIADGASFDDMDEAVAYAHEKLSEGPVRIEHYDVGAVDINPDEYWENFDGEFWCTPELAEWRDEVWKSMGIGASKSIKCSDADGIADEWEDIREISEQGYEYTGGTDDDMLEYVDEYLDDAEAWLHTDYVKYVSPDDWVVDASLSDEAVASDFFNFVDLYFEDRDMGIDLYEINTNGILGNDFFISFYPANQQFPSPQVELDEYYLTEKEYDVLSEAIPIYEKNRISRYKDLQNGLGEYLSSIASKINSSKDIKAGITVGEDSRFDFSNPIYELDDYVKAIADGVVNRIQGITYDISKETIAFFDEDNNVIFVQPIGGIIPEPDDLETDIDELSAAIQSEMDNAYARDNWGQDEDDSDYVTRAVEFSTDVKAAEETVDIDDLEYVTGDEDDEPAEDWGFGFDSNGNPIDESTVEELERIAQEVLDKSEIHNIDEYADLHNFNYYASIPYIQESFNIAFTYVADFYELSKRGLLTEDGIFTTVAPYNVHFNVRCKNGEVEYAECTDVDVNDGYVKDVELKNFNLDALVQFATDLVNPVAMDIYNATTNL